MKSPRWLELLSKILKRREQQRETEKEASPDICRVIPLNLQLNINLKIHGLTINTMKGQVTEWESFCK